MSIPLPDKPTDAHFDVRQTSDGFALDIRPTYQPLRFWKQPQGIGVVASFFCISITTIAVLGNILDPNSKSDLAAWPMFAIVLSLGIVLAMLLLNIAHKVTLSATLEVHGLDEDTTITLTYHSRIRPTSQKKLWHASEIACISNQYRGVERGNSATRFDPLELTLINDQRVALLNQLPQNERDWIATVLRGVTGLPSDFEVQPTE